MANKEKGLEIKSMHIKYVFTEEEKKDIALEMAKKISEKEDLELKKKEVTSLITSQISSANAAAANRAKELNQGYAWKNCDCYEVFDYDDKTVFTHRADTDAQVEVRTMTTTKYQREMFSPREEIKDQSEALQMAIRFKKEYPGEYSQAIKTLKFKHPVETFSDPAAIRVCEEVKKLLEEIPETGELTPNYKKKKPPQFPVKDPVK